MVPEAARASRQKERMSAFRSLLQLLLARVFLSNNKERKRANTCVEHVSGEEETNKENGGGILEEGSRSRCERGAASVEKLTRRSEREALNFRATSVNIDS